MSQPLIETARAVHEAGNIAEAARLYGEVLKSDAHNVEALYRLAAIQFERGQYEDAQRMLGEATRIAPEAVDAHLLRGRALQRLNRHQQALSHFERAIALDGAAEALCDKGNSLLSLGRLKEAIAAYDSHLAVHPRSAEAWHNRGVALARLKRCDDAVASFSKAIEIAPAVADGWRGRGSAYLELERFEEAASDYERALALDPELPYAQGYAILARLHCCDWKDLRRRKESISSALRAGRRVIQPFGNLMISEDPPEQAQCARIWMNDNHRAPPTLLAKGQRYGHKKIRVAYLSGDFRVHPVGQLMTGVFEHHDKFRFETIGVSIGPNDKSGLRTRIAAAFDEFIDARGTSDIEVASALRAREVDIAVDLMGLTGDCRPGILARAPAPVQVNYLGYPGTMAADAIDYILADMIVLPAEHQPFYREKAVYLPDTYLATDRSRLISGMPPSRGDAGLSEGFVFASFNMSYKFAPELFDIWMRLLAKVDRSMLWLPEGNAAARRNLGQEALARGINPERLIFAPHVKAHEDYLARLRLADLFLDTLPCNAHTTATDALWAGVPVLTCKGNSFAGRVGASLLSAVGLPELITDSLEAYEALALRLARNEDDLATLRTKLAANRLTRPLFDTARFTRNLERAFIRMWELNEAYQPPQSFSVAP
ncbi:MAG TPA: tetratricopeptide repeat protein [Micropepsaceae bacterium]|nr:tetratricopeptide repeat protein [Micropepsaceae bacterium]